MKGTTSLRTVEEAAAALDRLRTRLPALVQEHPDLRDFLPLFRQEGMALLARAATPGVRRYLEDELALILTELRAWPALDAWDSLPAQA